MKTLTLTKLVNDSVKFIRVYFDENAYEDDTSNYYEYENFKAFDTNSIIPTKNNRFVLAPFYVTCKEVIRYTLPSEDGVIKVLIKEN